MYDTLYVFCTTCKNIVVYSILCCFVYTCFFSAFKKIYTSKCASKLRNFVTIWLHDAFLCFLLKDCGSIGICTPENMHKNTLFMFLSYIVTKI